MPAINEISETDRDSFHENQAECQKYIRENCKVGDSILVYQFGGGEGILCKIAHLGIQSIDAVDEFGNTINNVVYKDDARLGSPQFLGATSSFDHTEEAKILMDIAKAGGIPDYSKLKDSVAEQMTPLLDVMSKKYQELEGRISLLEQNMLKYVQPSIAAQKEKPASSRQGKNAK